MNRVQAQHILNNFGEIGQTFELAMNIHILPNGCWEWMGRKDKDGYGMSKFMVGRTFRVHRIAYFFATGEWPSLLDHIVCNYPACCNPFHLVPSTNTKNVLRGNGPTAINARKTICPKGHPLVGENVVSHKGHPNWRTCRICRNERKRAAKSKPKLPC